MDTVTLAVFLSWLCGGFVAGVTSMGAALFAVPITAFFLPMQDAVLLSCLSLPFMMIAIVGLNVRACRLKSILPLLAGTVPGSVAGLWILEALPARTLRICVGLILVLFPVWHAAARIKPRGENWRAALAAGFLSGVLGTPLRPSTDRRPRRMASMRDGLPASCSAHWASTISSAAPFSASCRAMPGSIRIQSCTTPCGPLPRPFWVLSSLTPWPGISAST